METEASHQQKHERSRTRWTASLDKIFADLVVKQIQLGNRPNNVFDKKTWNHIRDEFNKQTDLNFNNNQLRKHLDVLRTRFYNIKSAYDQSNDFTIDDSCCIGFDLWEDIAAQPRPETVKVKECPIYEQLCTIFTDASADGKYAQSSHYGELDKSARIDNNGDLNSYPDGEIPSSENLQSSKPAQVNLSSAVKAGKAKRKRPPEPESSVGRTKRDEEICDAMAQAMLEMISASKLRTVAKAPNNDRFSITNCVKALDEIEGVDERVYFTALDLFEDPNLRETFISLKAGNIRLTWLQGKCGKIMSA